jgi:EAL domain-containing protein (putative c-di-GMP-specific phosphodiesterase class I)
MTPIHPANADTADLPGGLPGVLPCAGDCTRGESLGFQFSYAYQPIVDLRNRSIFAHEALVRGPGGESADTVLSQVTDANRYRFDQACRVNAVKIASRLNMASLLSINFMPNAIYQPELCLRTTLAAAKTHGFAIDRIVFETVEGERISDSRWLAEILREYKRVGFLTAIDDFGAGYAGLNLLADFQPDIVKLDMGLVRHIDAQPARQAIVRGISRICEELGITVIAEGVETLAECRYLQDLGVHLLQGHLFARPMFEACAFTEALAWPQLG